MGVKGLTSYILSNSSLYLKPYELFDCCIVVDGSSLAHTLAHGLKSHGVFGGDYDEYYTVVRSFMLVLKRCNIHPIILFDGGCERKKMNTRLSRRHATILKLKSFCHGFSEEEFFPLFMVEVFLNAVRDVGFTHVHCNLEADGEIAAVARQLNLPVLSYDSDYFIYGVKYIPFRTIIQPPVKCPQTRKYYLKCSIFDVDEFSKEIGVDKPLLPILATLLGNDHVENIVFFKFFNHISMPKLKHKSPGQRRIYGLIQWLKNENINTVVERIASHLKKKNAGKVPELFIKTINDYSTCTVTEAVLEELTSKYGDIHLCKSDLCISWPPEIAKLYAQTFIPGFLVNMTLHQIYLTPMQVENVYGQSSHFKSLRFIRVIYTMLTPYLKEKKPLELYLVRQKQYIPIKIYPDILECLNLHSVVKLPQEERLSLLCEIVGVPMEVLDFVPLNSWAIFILNFIYWSKEFHDSLSLAHVHAFVIMMIANQIVQTKVGYYRNSPDFMKHYKEKLNKLKDIEVIPEESSDFKEMLTKVKDYECLVVQKELIPLRRTTPEGSGKEYSLPTIHLFNCFQSSLYYIMIINALLNYPLPHLKIQDFYSGTLLFNLYICIKSKPKVENFGSTLFLKTPNLNQIYKYLSVKLSEISEITGGRKRFQRRKKSKKNKGSGLKEVDNVTCCPAEDEKEFMDENNFYALLNKMKD